MSPTGQERSPPALKPISWVLIVLSLLASLFLFALDNTIVADVQPEILLRFSENQKLPWLSVAYALAGAATQLFWAKLYGSFDSKWLFIAGFTIFEAGSAVCGASPTMNALIVGRTICGLGGIGLYLGVVNIISGLTTEAQRPLYVAFIGATWSIGTLLGPIIGGAFAESSATWRWAFYINLVIGGTAVPVYIFLIPSLNSESGVSIVQRTKTLDFLGGLLVCGAITSLMMAIAFGGSVYAWDSGETIGLFVTAGILWIFFTLQQVFCFLTTPERRVFPVRYARNLQMVLQFISMASGQVILFIAIYFLPLYFQFVRNDGALEAGVRLLPFIAPLVFTVMMNGALMAQLGYYMPWYFVGGILSVVGTALLYTISSTMSVGQIYGYSIIAGFGNGLYAIASFPIAQAKVGQAEVPEATAFIGCAQLMGITLALSMSNSIFLNEAARGIQSILPNIPREAVLGTISGANSALLEALDPMLQQQVLGAIVDGIKRAFILAIVAAAIILICSVFMKREKLFEDGVAIPQRTADSSGNQTEETEVREK